MSSPSDRIHRSTEVVALRALEYHVARFLVQPKLINSVDVGDVVELQAQIIGPSSTRSHPSKCWHSRAFLVKGYRSSSIVLSSSIVTAAVGQKRPNGRAFSSLSDLVQG